MVKTENLGQTQYLERKASPGKDRLAVKCEGCGRRVECVSSCSQKARKGGRMEKLDQGTNPSL